MYLWCGCCHQWSCTIHAGHIFLIFSMFSMYFTWPVTMSLLHDMSTVKNMPCGHTKVIVTESVGRVIWNKLLAVFCGFQLHPSLLLSNIWFNIKSCCFEFDTLHFALNYLYVYPKRNAFECFVKVAKACTHILEEFKLVKISSNFPRETRFTTPSRENSQTPFLMRLTH